MYILDGLSSSRQAEGATEINWIMWKVELQTHPRGVSLVPSCSCGSFEGFFPEPRRLERIRGMGKRKTRNREGERERERAKEEGKVFQLGHPGVLSISEVPSPRLRLAPLTMTKTTRTVTLIAAGWRLAFSTEFGPTCIARKSRAPPLKFTGWFAHPSVPRGQYLRPGEALLCDRVSTWSSWWFKLL